MLQQRTLKNVIRATGVGLHGGEKVFLTIHPAPVDTGIVFRRTDLDPVVEIPANADLVTETTLCTGLSAQGAKVQTVEHLMSALAGLGIDNCIIEISSPEIPIMDGSAAEFVAALACLGQRPQKSRAGARTAIGEYRAGQVGEGLAEGRHILGQDAPGGDRHMGEGEPEPRGLGEREGVAEHGGLPGTEIAELVVVGGAPRGRDDGEAAVAGRIWSMCHGAVMLEMAGFFGAEGHGLRDILSPLAVNFLVGMGDERERTNASLAAAAAVLVAGGHL